MSSNGSNGGERLLTPAEMGELWQVDAKTITRWARAGKLDDAVVWTMGGHRRYRESVVRALYAAHSGHGIAPIGHQS